MDRQKLVSLLQESQLRKFPSLSAQLCNVLSLGLKPGLVGPTSPKGFASSPPADSDQPTRSALRLLPLSFRRNTMPTPSLSFSFSN